MFNLKLLLTLFPVSPSVIHVYLYLLIRFSPYISFSVTCFIPIQLMKINRLKKVLNTTSSPCFFCHLSLYSSAGVVPSVLFVSAAG